MNYQIVNVTRRLLPIALSIVTSIHSNATFYVGGSVSSQERTTLTLSGINELPHYSVDMSDTDKEGYNRDISVAAGAEYAFSSINIFGEVSYSLTAEDKVTRGGIILSLLGDAAGAELLLSGDAAGADPTLEPGDEIVFNAAASMWKLTDVSGINTKAGACYSFSNTVSTCATISMMPDVKANFDLSQPFLALLEDSIANIFGDDLDAGAQAFLQAFAAELQNTFNYEYKIDRTRVGFQLDVNLSDDWKASAFFEVPLNETKHGGAFNNLLTADNPNPIDSLIEEPSIRTGFSVFYRI